MTYFFFSARTRAQRARAAAAILARPAALIVRFLDEAAGAAGAAAGLLPRIVESSFSSASILSLISAARLSCFADTLIEFMPRHYAE
ncbi:MAG TPA: hypothetical protein VFW05_02620 [Verrucomicrobiae bacterium]|nr:hypothetical protein [Verrucomicrobiae bacterium]